MDNKKNCNAHKTFYIKTFKDKGKTVAKNQYKKCTVCKIRLQGFFITEKKGNARFLTSSSLITMCHQWEVKKSKDRIKYIHVKSLILINNSNMLGLSGFCPMAYLSFLLLVLLNFHSIFSISILLNLITPI